ncbi:unnamed protein product, partial [Brassica oleracea]
ETGYYEAILSRRRQTEWDECNNPEGESEFVFDFKVHDYFWVIKECGLQLLELPHVHEDD